MTDSNKNNEEIFSGLESLGFDNINGIEIFKKETSETKNQIKNLDDTEKQLSMLYNKEITCPVCGNSFKARAVKISAPRVIKKDSDFFLRHDNINPYFYDVWLCNVCGYAAMKVDFEKIKNYQIKMIKESISTKWTGKVYPDTYDINIAIERYKLSLLNYVVMESKASAKAMNCLKLAWMYRLIENSNQENIFMKKALEGFNQAYYNEDFPIYGMHRYTTMYLIGELNRRTENYEQSLLWFSKVITTPSVPQKIKDMARDQRDIIKSSTGAKSEAEDLEKNATLESKHKKGIFSFLFK
ncbi:DUF2225 domain-containing protein [Clostridium amazonitimonense]|uniref:DUF2225 domain-containing protein n=1 Tax=Clostridium amazonitimonense TaxID=1499689 RepID=UPI000509B34C|nr:DUF2225 domain-containing protein [Clostridium amazonitimonense]